MSCLLYHASGFNKFRSVAVLDHQPELHEEPSCFSLLFFQSRVAWEMKPKWFVSDVFFMYAILTILAFCSGFSLLKYARHADCTRVACCLLFHIILEKEKFWGKFCVTFNLSSSEQQCLCEFYVQLFIVYGVHLYVFLQYLTNLGICLNKNKRIGWAMLCYGSRVIS